MHGLRCTWAETSAARPAARFGAVRAPDVGVRPQGEPLVGMLLAYWKWFLSRLHFWPHPRADARRCSSWVKAVWVCGARPTRRRVRSDVRSGRATGQARYLVRSRKSRPRPTTGLSRARSPFDGDPPTERLQAVLLIVPLVSISLSPDSTVCPPETGQRTPPAPCSVQSAPL